MAYSECPPGWLPDYMSEVPVSEQVARERARFASERASEPAPAPETAEDITAEDL